MVSGASCTIETSEIADHALQDSAGARAGAAACHRSVGYDEEWELFPTFDSAFDDRRKDRKTGSGGEENAATAPCLKNPA